MEETKLKFAKRKLRVQRCKSLPGATKASAASHPSTHPTKSSKPIPIVPKGDPALGAKLAHVPQEERKQVKSADADRVARRLAKKKARIALSNAGVKPQLKDRDRERVRKTGSGAGKHVPSKSKGRVRSDKSMSKRNAKK